MRGAAAVGHGPERATAPSTAIDPRLADVLEAVLPVAFDQGVTGICVSERLSHITHLLEAAGFRVEQGGLFVGTWADAPEETCKMALLCGPMSPERPNGWGRAVLELQAPLRGVNFLNWLPSTVRRRLYGVCAQIGTGRWRAALLVREASRSGASGIGTT